jgi:murein DD-endopeptidase MepM/ murein hydrolase activator NlpD
MGKGGAILLAIGGAACIAVGWGLYKSNIGPSYEELQERDQAALVVEPEIPFDHAYGIPTENLTVQESTVKRGETLAGILVDEGVDYGLMDSLVRATDSIFDVRRIRSGRPYSLLKDSDSTLQYFVYEIDALEHVIYSFKDSVSVTRKRKPIDTVEQFVEVQLNGALYNELAAQGADPLLSLSLSEAFAWTVDFYRIQKGDVFRVLYEQQEVEGEKYGMPKILAAHYESGEKTLEGYLYNLDGQEQLFDRAGNSLKKAFLKAPLKFSRITSGYSGRRFHPVQKRWKSHKGTDYAAPRGTPIMSVGEGVVEKAGYTGGNGRYVKIRHNGTYSTQYLHMSKILVTKGQRVSQGETIGLVGSTGLATGPHVCFRFWKNGEQVDHRREEFPSADPVPQEQMSAFNQQVDLLSARMKPIEPQEVVF